MSQTRRILMVSGSAPPLLDGVGASTEWLVDEIARQRPEWKLSWISRRPRWYSSPIVREHGGLKIRPSHTWSPRGVRLIQRTIRALRPDLIHIQEQIHSFFETDAACRIADVADELKVPLVATLHEYHAELPSVVHTTEIARRADSVIANDPRNASRCREHAGRTPDAQWWSGCTIRPPDAASRPATVPGRLTTFGFIGGLKSLGIVAAGLRSLRKDHPELFWKIIGPFDPATNPEHARISADVGTDGVEFTGPFPAIDDPRLKALLAESQIMILPYKDGASLRRGTLQVAWAFGLPVITTPPPHETDAIQDGVNCILVHEATPEAWAQAILRVHTDAALAERLRAGSLAAAERFSNRRLAELHIELYERLLAEPRSTGPRPSPAAAEGAAR